MAIRALFALFLLAVACLGLAPASAQPQPQPSPPQPQLQSAPPSQPQPQPPSQPQPRLQGAPSALPQSCLAPYEQRAAVFQGLALPLGMARRSLRPHDGDEMLRARLCYGQGGMVYVLTLLSRNGRVTNTIVDARTGRVIGVR